MSEVNIGLRGLLLAAFSLTSGSMAQAQSFSIYLSPPSTQSTFVSGASTATFNSPLATGKDTTAYVTPIGTYQFSATNPGAIQVADQYGGANGSQYLAIGSQSGSNNGVTVNLNASNKYFGFWFSAGDNLNNISFYNSTTLLATYNVQSILTLLGGSTVTAINGTSYSSSSYFGNPNAAFAGMNSSQPYSYVDIVANGATFNKIVFDNSGSQSTGFESDNHSVYAGAVTIPGGDVLVTSVPEPSSYALMFGGLIGALVAGQRLLGKLRLRPIPVQ